MISHWYTQPLTDGSKRRHVKSDPQKQYVYQMERELMGNSINQHMTLPDLRRVAKHCCRKWCVPQVIVKTIRKPKMHVFGWTTGRDVVLNTAFHGDNIGVLMHELAHWVTFHLYPDAIDHGGEFMDVYADLLAQYKILPRDCLLVLAARYGVEVGDEHV